MSENNVGKDPSCKNNFVVQNPSLPTISSEKESAPDLGKEVKKIGESDSPQSSDFFGFLEEIHRFWFDGSILETILQDLDRRIKRDEATKLSVFFTALSAYTKEPINLFLKGESGIGKSYNVLQVLDYFPKSDVWKLGNISPKTLIHERGILMDKYGKPVDLTKAPAKPKRSDFADLQQYLQALEEYRAFKEAVRDGYTLVDLSNKILVFLEAPDPETFRVLYPILSHDSREIEYKFTDKTERGGFVARRVVIRGYPAVIFCSTDRKYVEELSTRCFTTSPEGSKDKIKLAKKLITEKSSWFSQGEEKTAELIKNLIAALKLRFLAGDVDALIPFLNLDEIFPSEIVRDMRDYQHFIHFLKTYTLLFYFQRPHIKADRGRYVVATVDDVRGALSIFSKIFLTTRTGTEERILRLYKEIVSKPPDNKPWTVRDLTTAINLKETKKVSQDWVRRVLLARLVELGLVTDDDDPEDSRRKIYIPLVYDFTELGEIERLLSDGEKLKAKLEEGLKAWFDAHRDDLAKLTIIYPLRVNESEGKIEYMTLTPDELYQVVVGDKKLFMHNPSLPTISSEQKSSPESEKEGEKIGEPKNQQSSDFSAKTEAEINVLKPTYQTYVCSYCSCRFSTTYDLNRHIQTNHRKELGESP
jgi:hypothetical protein